MVIEFFSSVPSIISSLLGITFVVVFHEFGHFLFAKLFKVYVPAFSIGIGKKIFSKRIGETDFCVSLWPVGGYVEIPTENSADGRIGFNSIAYWKKFLIILGGIFFNIILTFLIFSFIFFIGAPESPMLPYNRNINKVEFISPESINHEILKADDVFIKVNKIEINDDTKLLFETIRNIAASVKDCNQKEDKKLHQATVLRDGNLTKVTLKIHAKDPKFFSLKQYLDIDLEKKAPLSIIESLKQAFFITILYAKAITKSLKSIASGKKLDGFAGPIMAVATGSKSAKQGFSHLLLLLAIISINLAIMNLIPLPIFDGGQIVIFTIETLMRRPLSEKAQNIISTGSWLFVVGLFIVFSLKDAYTLYFFS
jgi:regulator of sigma E protease